MAGEEKKVVIDIDIKAEDILAAKDAMDKATDSMAEYRSEADKLKGEQKQLNTQLKEGELTMEEYRAEQAKITLQQKEVSKNLRESSKSFADNKRIIDATKGSNEQLRARLSVLTKQYNGLSKEQRENSAEGKKMGSTMKSLTDKLKENESAVGDNRRNVGNYQEAIENALGSVNVMGVNVGGLVKQLKTQKEILQKMVVAQKASNVATGVGTKAMRIFKIALASTGIGLLIVALGSLVSFFTQTKRGVELMDQALAGIRATVSVLVDRLSMLGEALVKVFGGDFEGAAEQAKSAVSGVTEEIVKETKAAADLEKQMQKLTDAERALTVERANSRAEIKRLNLIAEDTTKSLKEREEAAQSAIDIEKRLMAESIRLAQERVDIITKQNEQGERLREDLDKQAEAEKVLADIKMESLEMQTTLNNKLNTIRQQEHAKHKKIQDEKLKATEKERKAEEKLEKERKKRREEFRLESLEEIEREKAKAIKKAKIWRESGVDEEKVNAFLSKKLIEIDRDERKARIDEKLKFYDEEAELAQQKAIQNIEDEEVRTLTLAEIERSRLEARAQLLDLEAMQYQSNKDALGVIDEEFQREMLLQKEVADAELVALDREKTDALIEHTGEVKAEQMAALQASGNLVGDILGGIKGMMDDNIARMTEQAKAAGKTEEEIAQITKKARKEAHQMEIAMAIVQTLQAAISAYSAGSAVPIVGVALGPIAAAAAMAFGFAQVAQMSKQKFAKGGVLKGRTHGQGGIPISVNGRGGYEAEHNEIVLTKGVYQNPRLRRAASDLNVLGGGRSLLSSESTGHFAAGGVLNQNSTFTARQHSSGMGLTRRDITDAMGEAVRQMPPPQVSVGEIERVSARKQKVQVTSEI